MLVWAWWFWRYYAIFGRLVLHTPSVTLNTALLH